MDILDFSQHSYYIQDFVNNKSGNNLFIRGIKECQDKNLLDYFRKLKYKKIKIEIDLSEPTKSQGMLSVIQLALQLEIPNSSCKIQKLFEQNRETKTIRLYLFLVINYLKYTVKEPESFEKIIINFSKQAQEYQLKQILEYVKQFPSLKYLKMNILKCDERFSQENLVNIVKSLDNVKEIEILTTEYVLHKKDGQIQIEIINNQVLTDEKTQNPQGLKIVQKLSSTIDLTKTNLNKELIKQAASQPEFVNIPKVLKINGTKNHMQAAKQILQRFPNIATIIMTLNKETEEDLFDQFHEMTTHINRIKHFVAQDKGSFIERHNQLMKIAQLKHKDFKVTYERSHQQVIYSPANKYLKIKNSNEYLDITQDQYSQAFELYPNATKISLHASFSSIQTVINILPKYPNIRKVKLILTSDLTGKLDFSPLYSKVELARLKLFYDGHICQTKLQQTLKSMLNDTTCPVIASKYFTLNSESKCAFIQISSLDYKDLFSIDLFSKFNIQQIIMKNHFQTYPDFLFDLIFAPSVISICRRESYSFNPADDQNKLFQTLFHTIIVQKLQIFYIKKYLSDYIPIHMPSLIYDLY